MKRTMAGFNLVELLIVIFVIGILATLVIVNVIGSRERTYFSRAEVELNTMANALKLYAAKHNDYPADVNRNLPPGIEEFIAKNDQGGDWPDAPWPGSVYDYDNWTISGTPTIQISIRFCPIGGPLSACHFPKEDWAADFDINSAVYYCIKGLCRPHQGEPATYPGYCVNCPDHKAIGT